MISIPGYKITKTIGRGGMATVYLATQESVGRLVAIKVMTPALAADPSFSDRFLKEARMANLTHPNIVTVYDAGTVDDTNFIVMEYASGGNFDSLIKHGISISRTIEVIKQIAGALHYSCSKGFIHRDVKPENIILREDGTAVLMDFGIAKAISSGTQLTVVGSTIGSPNYMSPEQARGLELDGRSDLYSLGIVLYEALTGTKPYDASDTFVIGLKHINDPIPQLPGDLDQFQPIINQLLAKIPQERFANGNLLIEALESFNMEDSISGSTLTKNDQDSSHHKIDTKPSNNKFNPDEKTYRVNSISDDPTLIVTSQEETLADRPLVHYEPGETDKMGETRDEIEISETGDTRISDKTRINIDKTRLQSVDDETRINPAQKNADSDDTIILQRTPKPDTPQKNKTGLSIFLVLVILAGGFGLWLNSQPEKTETVVVPPVQVETSNNDVAIEAPQPEKVESEGVQKEIQEDVKESSESANTDRINKLLARARHAMTVKHFTSPADDNAFDYYSQILSFDQNNIDALAGLDQIADRYLNLAQTRIASKKTNQALTFINKGLKIIPDHKKLLALKDKIEQKNNPLPASIAKNKRENTETNKDKSFSPYRSLLLKDLTVKETSGSHISNTTNNAKWFAQQDMTNRLYNRMLSQCNASDRFLDRPECTDIYQKYLKHWPLPLKGVLSQFSKVDVNKSLSQHKTRIKFDEGMFTQTYQKRLHTFSRIFTDDTRSELNQILALSNYSNYQSLAALLGIKTEKIKPELIKEYLEVRRKHNPKIKSKKELITFISEYIDDKTVYLSPIISNNSLEVTPYSSALFDILFSKIKHAQITAENHLFIEYALNPDGSITLDLRLFDVESELIALDSLILDSDFLGDKRKSNLIFYNDINPQQRLKSSYGFPASIAMDTHTDNPRLLINETTRLNVKLSQPGFYFIAVHVIHAKKQYSYLLPLLDADEPFVKITTKEQANRFIELGKFKVTEPAGVEVIQLIASSINLKKYLPDNHWDEKLKQYIIDGSEGNIRKGINEVRNYINTLPKVSHDKNVRWQERLMVTSIL